MPPQKVKGSKMADLAVFIPDEVNTARWEVIGAGRCLYLRYAEKKGFFAKRRVKKHLKKAAGCTTLDRGFAEKLSLPHLSGDANRLLLAICYKLVPSEAAEEGLVLSVGKVYDTEAILEIARNVRTLELICPEGGEALAEKIEEETGLSVPVYTSFPGQTEKPCLRLPGGIACGEGAIDVSCPLESCVFAPPAGLRALCTKVGTDGDTIEALLQFFGYTLRDADVFLSKSTKSCRK